jgi:hypothetical protein
MQYKRVLCRLDKISDAVLQFTDLKSVRGGGEIFEKYKTTGGTKKGNHGYGRKTVFC